MPNILEDHHYTAGTTVRIAVSNTAISLGDVDKLAYIQPTSGTWLGYSATMVQIQPVGSYGVYYCLGGTTPLTDGSLGHVLALEDLLSLRNFSNIKNAKFIRQGSNDAYIMVTPFFNDAGK